MDVQVEQAELGAVRAQWAGFPGAQVRDLGPLLVLSARGPSWLRQVRGVLGDDDLDPLREALALVPDATVPLVDGTVDPARLAALGLQQVPSAWQAGPLVRMVAGVDDVAPLLPVDVVGPDRAALVEELGRDGFGLHLPGWWSAPLGRPGWTQLVVLEDQVPVATAGLHVAGPVGWIGAAATLPSHRGRGAHAALLAARLRLARTQGASRVCAKAGRGSPSYRNLRRAGFTEVHGLSEWARR